MRRRSMKITMIWKFVFWPAVWGLIFLPALFWAVSLQGWVLILARIAGSLLLLYSLFLASTGGRTLAKMAHQEAHETFWPDRFTKFGIFSCMRHPMHMGLAIFPVAVAMILGLIAPILASGWGVAAAFWFVLQIEEKDALNKFGSTYTDYMQDVPPFSFGLCGIKEGLRIWGNK